MITSHRFKRAVPLSALALAIAACSLGAPSEPASAPERDPLASTYRAHLPMLDEDVTYVKSATELYVVRASGARQTFAQVAADEKAAKWKKMGALTPELAALLANAKEGEVLPIAAYFAPDLGDESLAALSASPDEGERLEAEKRVFKAITARNADFARMLEASGVEVKIVGESMPVVFGLAKVDVVHALAWKDGVTVLASAADGEVERNAAKNGVSDPKIDAAFNARGFFGSGQKIAYLETAQDGLFEAHEAFANVTPDPATGQKITYEVEPRDCTTSLDCPFFESCAPLGRSGHARQCLNEHGSMCTSVAVGSTGSVPWGAARARVYYPNRGASMAGGTPSVACSPTGLQDAYDWLRRNGVTTVSESYSCPESLGSGRFDDHGDLDGLTQDWYARYSDIAIAKAAGNRQTHATPDPDQPACPNTLNSTCVGGIDARGAMSCFSSYTNLNGPTRTRTDREEPDVVALAGQYINDCTGIGDGVDVMDPHDPTHWVSDEGTSYAASAITALTALLKESCGGSMHHSLVRAILRTASWSRNPQDFRYSTTVEPRSATSDWRDGAGALLADNALAFCRPGSAGPNVKSGLNSGRLSGGTPPPFGAGCQSCGGRTPVGGLSDDVSPLSTAPIGGASDPRRYNGFWSSGGALPVGTRIRTTLAWDSCPGAMSGTAPASVATDIDVVLYNRTTHRAIYSSQSVSDNVEGFDITIDAASGPGVYELAWTYPDGAMGCGGTGAEPFAWAVAWGAF